VATFPSIYRSNRSPSTANPGTQGDPAGGCSALEGRAWLPTSRRRNFPPRRNWGIISQDHPSKTLPICAAKTFGRNGGASLNERD
jgi:hypothetical protein